MARPEIPPLSLTSESMSSMQSFTIRGFFESSVSASARDIVRPRLVEVRARKTDVLPISTRAVRTGRLALDTPRHDVVRWSGMEAVTLGTVVRAPAIVRTEVRPDGVCLVTLD